MKLLAILLMLSGCASWQDYHAVNKRTATCDVTNPDQIEAMDLRTGFPLLSTPHPYSCHLDPTTMQVVWESENRSEESLEAFSDLPSAIIQRGIPSGTVAY